MLESHPKRTNYNISEFYTGNVNNHGIDQNVNSINTINEQSINYSYEKDNLNNKNDNNYINRKNNNSHIAVRSQQLIKKNDENINESNNDNKENDGIENNPDAFEFLKFGNPLLLQ